MSSAKRVPFLLSPDCVFLQTTALEYGQPTPFLSPLQQDYAKALQNGTTALAKFPA